MVKKVKKVKKPADTRWPYVKKPAAKKKVVRKNVIKEITEKFRSDLDNNPRIMIQLTELDARRRRFIVNLFKVWKDVTADDLDRIEPIIAMAIGKSVLRSI